MKIDPLREEFFQTLSVNFFHRGDEVADDGLPIPFHGSLHVGVILHANDD